uniref:Uncharacterized protein n=1 Tax=Rhizophora mucronata TaxID=61149 RepID=A0A2P2Q015_RHIMU
MLPRDIMSGGKFCRTLISVQIIVEAMDGHGHEDTL